MYYGHFGLTQPPFRITPNTEFFYSGGNRGPILEALIYAIGQGEGIIKVTGEVGSGKTMLCSMLQARLPAHVETVYLANPSVPPEEILHAIAIELHLDPPRGAGYLETMQLLHGHLLERHAQGKQVVMFVEESQSMPLATLEQIRLLSNLETANSKLLQIVLFGQPELDDNLRQPQIRQLRERITHTFRLSPLKTEEIRDYLNFRVRAAGYRGPDLFSTPIVMAIAKASEGLTRRVNLIADKAMLAAFSENTHSIKLKHVKAAVRDSEFSDNVRPRRGKLGYAWSAFVLGTALGIALLAGLQAYRDANRPLAEPVAALPPVPIVRNKTETGAPAEPIPVIPPRPVEEKPSVSPAVADPPGPVLAPAPNAAPTPPQATTGKIAEDENKSINKQRVEPVVSTRSLSPQSAGETLEARLAATHAWLAREPHTTYSIQLLGADDPQQLKQHLNTIRKYVDTNEIFVYRTVARQKPSLTVLYGSFSQRQAALDALASLPAQLKAYRPVLRTVQGIRAELAQHQPS